MPLTLARSRPAPRVLLGFALVLCALFALSFGAGRLVGPVSVSPGRHGDGSMPGMPGMAGPHTSGLGTPVPAAVTGVAR